MTIPDPPAPDEPPRTIDSLDLLLAAWLEPQPVHRVMLVSHGVVAKPPARAYVALLWPRFPPTPGAAPVEHAALIRTLTPESAAAWAGYRFEMLGVQVTRPWDGEAGPIWSCETPTGGAIYVRFLRQRAWFGTSAVYAERLAIPGHPECHHVGGMRPDAPPTVDKAARDGLRRLLELDLRTGSGGRPSEPQARARGRLLKAGRRALKRLDIAPQQLTRPMVAQELNRSAAPGKNPRADDVWTRAKWRLPDLKRALDDEETRV